MNTRLLASVLSLFKVLKVLMQNLQTGTRIILKNQLVRLLKSVVYCFRKVGSSFTVIFSTYILVLKYSSLQKNTFQVSVDDSKVSVVRLREVNVFYGV